MPALMLTRRDLLEQPNADIDIVGLASLASVNNGRPVVRLLMRVPDADFGAALGVLVGVGGSAHDGCGEGDDVVVGGGSVAAGSDDGGVFQVVG